MQSAAAFFDLDKTVIAKSSTLAFGRPLYRAGFLSRRALMKAGIAQVVYMMFGADHDQMERVREQLSDLTAGWDRYEVQTLVQETLDEAVAPHVFAEALVLIDEHLREGRRVVIVSSSPEEVVKPLARYLGVREVIATRSKLDTNGRYTGDLDFYAYGEGKADALREYADREGISLGASYAYSDSITDAPMLAAVGHPVAVNPDKELRELAEEQGWPTMEFQRPVTLRTRLASMPKEGVIASGAAATAAICVAVGLWLLKKRKS